LWVQIYDFIFIYSRNKQNKTTCCRFFFALCSFIRTFTFAEGTFTRQCKKKKFFFALCSFIRTFTFVEGTFTRQCKKKKFFFALCSFIRTFAKDAVCALWVCSIEVISIIKRLLTETV